MEMVLTSPRRADGVAAGSALFLGIVALAAAGCGGGAGPAKPSASSANDTSRSTRPVPGTPHRGSPSRRLLRPAKPGPVTTVDYPLKGIVRSVAPESGRVLIRHQRDPRLHEGDDHAVRAGRRSRSWAAPPRRRGRGDPAGREAGRGGPGLPTSGPEGHETGCPEDDGPRRIEREGPDSREAPTPAGGRGGARFRHDRPGRETDQAIRPARQGGCTDVHLYTMSDAGFLPDDGSEILGAGAAPERFPEACQGHPADLAVIRPGE